MNTAAARLRAAQSDFTVGPFSYMDAVHLADEVDSLRAIIRAVVDESNGSSPTNNYDECWWCGSSWWPDGSTVMTHHDGCAWTALVAAAKENQ